MDPTYTATEQFRMRGQRLIALVLALRPLPWLSAWPGSPELGQTSSNHGHV